MKSSQGHRALIWLRNLLGIGTAAPAEIVQARKLIAAVERGGIPLNPAKVNAIARDLGLEVSRQAAVEETIERIRQALLRVV